MTREELKYWQEHLSIGDVVKYDNLYGGSKGTVIELRNDFGFVLKDPDSLMDKRNVPWKYLIEVYPKEIYPEYYL